jgi:signal transduction histidine kinase
VSPIVVDGDKVRRVLTNLLSNAVKFSAAGGTVKVLIDVHETQPEEGGRFDIFEPERNRNLRLRVIDGGIGIPKDKCEQIFDAFFQVDNSSTREFGGTGLGLSIVRNFVAAHKGRIDVESEPDQGSTFTVILPYVADDVAEIGAELFSGQRSA